jgi:hypothetical protein
MSTFMRVLAILTLAALALGAYWLHSVQMPKHAVLALAMLYPAAGLFAFAEAYGRLKLPQMKRPSMWESYPTILKREIPALIAANPDATWIRHFGALRLAFIVGGVLWLLLLQLLWQD